MRLIFLLFFLALPARASVAPWVFGSDGKSVNLQTGLALPQASTPASPVTGRDYLYFKSDDNLYMKNSSGTETQVNGGGSSISLGAFGSTPNANGLSLGGGVLNMQPADATHPGGVSTTTQAFAGPWTLTNALAVAGGSNATGGALNIQALGTSLNQGLNMTSSDGTVTWNLVGRGSGGGELFLFDGSNVQFEFTGSLIGLGPASPAFHVDVNRTDSNTTQTTPGIVTVLAVRNGDGTNGNFSTLGFANSGPQLDAVIEGIHSTNANSNFAGKLVFLTSTGGALALHEQITEVGHVEYTGSAFTVTCNSNAGTSIVGSDQVGRFTAPATPGTSCVVTFANAWTHAPHCDAVDESTPAILPMVAGTGTATITDAGLAVSHVVSFQCAGYF